MCHHLRVQKCCPGMILLAGQLGEGCVTLEQGLGSAFRSHRDEGLGLLGKGGPCSLQIPLLIAELSSELGWGAQRKLQSLLSRKENDHMEGWLEQGGRGQRENALWHSGVAHRAGGLTSDIQTVQLFPGCFSWLF